MCEVTGEGEGGGRGEGRGREGEGRGGEEKRGEGRKERKRVGGEGRGKGGYDEGGVGCHSQVSFTLHKLKGPYQTVHNTPGSCSLLKVPLYYADSIITMETTTLTETNIVVVR